MTFVMVGETALRTKDGSGFGEPIPIYIRAEDAQRAFMPILATEESETEPDPLDFSAQEQELIDRIMERNRTRRRNG